MKSSIRHHCRPALALRPSTNENTAMVVTKQIVHAAPTASGAGGLRPRQIVCRPSDAEVPGNVQRLDINERVLDLNLEHNLAALPVEAHHEEMWHVRATGG